MSEESNVWDDQLQERGGEENKETEWMSGSKRKLRIYMRVVDIGRGCF